MYIHIYCELSCFFFCTSKEIIGNTLVKKKIYFVLKKYTYFIYFYMSIIFVSAFLEFLKELSYYYIIFYYIIYYIVILSIKN